MSDFLGATLGLFAVLLVIELVFGVFEDEDV